MLGNDHSKANRLSTCKELYQIFTTFACKPYEGIHVKSDIITVIDFHYIYSVMQPSAPGENLKAGTHQPVGRYISAEIGLRRSSFNLTVW